MFDITNCLFIDSKRAYFRRVGRHLGGGVYEVSDVLWRRSCTVARYPQRISILRLWRNGFDPLDTDDYLTYQLLASDHDAVYFSPEHVKLRRDSIGDPGVYRLYDGDTIVYIGSAGILNSRAMQSVEAKMELGKVTHLDYLPTATRDDAATLEAIEIAKWKPRYNKVGKERKTADLKIAREYVPSERVAIWNSSSPLYVPLEAA